MLQIVTHEIQNSGTWAYAVAALEKIDLQQAPAILQMDEFDPEQECLTLVDSVEILNLYPRVPVGNPNWNPDRKATEFGDEPDESTPTVGHLADIGELAVRLFTDSKVEEDFEDYNISDLITNLCHLCHKAGFDVDEVIERGVRNFRIESTH